MLFILSEWPCRTSNCCFYVLCSSPAHLGKTSCVFYCKLFIFLFSCSSLFPLCVLTTEVDSVSSVLSLHVALFPSLYPDSRLFFFACEADFLPAPRVDWISLWFQPQLRAIFSLFPPLHSVTPADIFACRLSSVRERFFLSLFQSFPCQNWNSRSVSFAVSRVLVIAWLRVVPPVDSSSLPRALCLFPPPTLDARG